MKTKKTNKKEIVEITENTNINNISYNYYKSSSDDIYRTSNNKCFEKWSYTPDFWGNVNAKKKWIQGEWFETDLEPITEEDAFLLIMGG